MKIKQKYKNLKQDIDKFRYNFYDMVYLIKLLKYLIETYMNNDGDFIENSNYVTLNCLFSFINTVDNLASVSEKEMIRISAKNI